ncbi:Release factor glutamine methyltransferase [uncultured archaeon]|nr:Release factor glutamine methyltransferase [uncultured archaeon]
MKQKFSKNIFASSDAQYMSCPEEVAQHLAKNLSKFNTAVELCSGVGVTTIQLAKQMKKVTGVDINQENIFAAKKNAVLYGVSDKTEFILGDVLSVKLLKSIKAEVAVLDPDWSNQDSDKTKHVLELDKTQPNLKKLYNLTKKYVTNNIVARVPKTFTLKTISKLGPCNIENVYWGNKLRFKIAYFLGTVDKTVERDVFFD